MSIYEIAIGQTCVVGKLLFCRVPGGWLVGNTADGASDVFVPYNNEFQIEK